MTTLTMTSRGQITFRKELLRHLGVQTGQKLQVNLLPGGKCMIEAAKPQGSASDIVGLLKGKTNKKATLDEISAAAARGWAGQ